MGAAPAFTSGRALAPAGARAGTSPRRRGTTTGAAIRVIAFTGAPSQPPKPAPAQHTPAATPLPTESLVVADLSLGSGGGGGGGGGAPAPPARKAVPPRATLAAGPAAAALPWVFGAAAAAARAAPAAGWPAALSLPQLSEQAQRLLAGLAAGAGGALLAPPGAGAALAETRLEQTAVELREAKLALA
jgi:hypothetical protein